MEVLIAALLTGVMTAAAFRVYVHLHEQSEVQIDVTETQLICKNSLYDIKKTIRMAGYMLTGHPPYEINGDSLAVYLSRTQPVDTVLYYLEEFTDEEYAAVPDLPSGRKLWKLMKRVNSNPANMFADFLTNINYNVIDSANVVVWVQAQTPRKDHSFNQANGYRTFAVSERVKIRNLN